MKKYLPLILTLPVISVLTVNPAFAGSTLAGDSGFINTPSSEVIGDRRINLGVSYLPGARSYLFIGNQNIIYSFHVGFIPRTEFGIVFNQAFGWVTPDNPYLKDSAFDRSVNFKFQILDDNDSSPSLAIGARDLLSNGLINPTRLIAGNSFQQIIYLVAGKRFQGFNFNLGYSYAPGIPFGFKPDATTLDFINKSFRIKGFFGAIESPKLFSLVSAIIEYDSKQFNYGLNIGPIFNLEAKLGMVDLINFNFRVNVAAKL